MFSGTTIIDELMNETDRPRLDWPKEVLEYLQRDGPFWSAGLGIVLLVAGRRLG